MASTQTRVIVVLLAVLLAVVAVSALVLFVLPSSQNSVPTTTPDTVPSSTSDSPLSSSSAGAGNGTAFNVSVLQKAGYIFLDKRLLNEGLLPVQPPSVVGKANPFL